MSVEPKGAAADADEPSSDGSSSDGPGGRGGILDAWLRSGLAAMLVALALAGGGVALVLTPREEEPQIDVPLIDVFVEAPGLSAEAVERRVTWPIEQSLFGAEGVEHLYSTSLPGRAVVTARFYVGEDPYAAQVRVRNRMERNRHRFPPALRRYQIRPVHVDDVPFMTLTLHGDTTAPAELLSLGEEMLRELTSIEGVGLVFIAGGRNLEAAIDLDPQRMTAHGVTLRDLEDAVHGANVFLPAGSIDAFGRRVAVDVGEPLKEVERLRALVVSTIDGRAVALEDVAEVRLAPAESRTHVEFARGPASEEPADADAPPGSPLGRSAVTLALAKRAEANAVTVSERVRRLVDELRPALMPDDVELTITRDYGRSADEAVDWLVYSLLAASMVVIALLAVSLGMREALIVAVSVPTTFATTLLVNELAGYTLNRVTLFALIVALGLIVDDSIVSIDNIHRWLHTSAGAGLDRLGRITGAVREVVPPMVLTSIVVVVAFVPLAFVTGLMGPYMAPMALAVPVAMVASTTVAVLVVPWLALVVFADAAGEGRRGPGEGRRARSRAGGRDRADEGDDVERTLRYRLYARAVTPFLDRRRYGLGLVVAAAVLLAGALALPVLGLIPLKLLPYDDTEKLQFVIDMPEGTPVERTASVAADLAELALAQREVVDVTTYAGRPSPVDFNGLVRGHYLRRGEHVGDVRVNMLKYDRRHAGSHEIALRMRDRAERIAERHGASVTIVERPPGPPVLAPIVAEVRGPREMPYEQLLAGGRRIERLVREQAGVVDVDTSIEASAPRLVYEIDQREAALVGVSARDVGRLMSAALAGVDVDVLRDDVEMRPRPIRLRLPAAERVDRATLESLPLARVGDRVLTAGELGGFRETTIEQSIERKDLDRVVYVKASLAGRTPIDAVMAIDEALTRLEAAGGIDPRIDVRLDGEGEWFITRRVFRDLGVALGVAVIAIFALLVYQTGSYLVAVVLLTSIPLTVIGIMPGFWLLDVVLSGSSGGYRTNVHFTATAMIGIVALAGIAVRNAILLIDFTRNEQRRGRGVRASILRAGAMRVRPILLTAGTAMLAVVPIAFDPVFLGLAWALIFGLFVSTAFTLVLVPTLYGMIRMPRDGRAT